MTVCGVVVEDGEVGARTIRLEAKTEDLHEAALGVAHGSAVASGELADDGAHEISGVAK
jgi:hypothetical protein